MGGRELFNCRFCGRKLENIFVSLGKSPLSNAYLTKDMLKEEERYYPLDVYVCNECFLVQLPEHETPENIFSEYAYFSSYAGSWLDHARDYAEKMIDSLSLGWDSFVVEAASNDGYLLQYFVDKGIPVLGIEPAKNVAKVAVEKGVPTEVLFLGKKTAETVVAEYGCADLVIGNNVLAHVPDVNDFVGGLRTLLKPQGVITLEFPHLMRLVDAVQFDTIYHEHFSYFSLMTTEKIFEKQDLQIFDVEELPTHGGSLRIYVKHRSDNIRKISEKVNALRKKEIDTGYADVEFYLSFSNEVEKVREKVMEFLWEAKKNGKSVIGYGAAAKGNTLLNYCGIDSDLIEYVADRTPYKQGKFLPGSHIPVVAPDKIKETKPDYVVILPWNLKKEIKRQRGYIKDWGGKFVTFIPSVEVD